MNFSSHSGEISIIANIISELGIITDPIPKIVAIGLIKYLTKHDFEFDKAVGDSILELQDKYEQLRPENLKNNEEFWSMLLKASMIAATTMKKEKIEAARNTVINGLLLNIEESKQALYLRFIDELVVDEYIMLKFFDNPFLYYQSKHKANPEFSGKISRLDYFLKCFPNYSKSKDYVIIFYDHLINQGLLKKKDYNVSIMNLHNSSSTSIGKEFLHIIENPK